MWLTLHYIIVAVYLLAPAVAVAVDVVRGRRSKSPALSAHLILTILAGAFLAVSIVVAYSIATKAWPSAGQVGLAAYFAIGMLCILKSIDAVMKWGVQKVSDRYKGRGRRVRWPMVAMASTVRIVILFGLGLPYVMAAVVTYRPKVVARDNPQTQLGFRYESVSFKSSDGIYLSAWWIPAEQKSVRQSDSPDLGTRTVIVFHGLASSKSNHLIMSRAFVPAGYNVLIFDFRAHGESGGQLASFGDLERRDVLASVKWLRANKPHASQKIFGVGASMGAAALICAAADESPEGQAIDAVAVYGTFDDLVLTERAVSRRGFPPVMRQVVDLFAIPMAGAHVGSDLTKFKPASVIGNIWPRPVMIIHGVGDEIIPFERGKALYDAAHQPKKAVWLQKSDHNSIIADEDTARQVLEFFNDAEPLPII